MKAEVTTTKVKKSRSTPTVEITLEVFTALCYSRPTTELKIASSPSGLFRDFCRNKSFGIHSPLLTLTQQPLPGPHLEHEHSQFLIVVPLLQSLFHLLGHWSRWWTTALPWELSVELCNFLQLLWQVLGDDLCPFWRKQVSSEHCGKEEQEKAGWCIGGKPKKPEHRGTLLDHSDLEQARMQRMLDPEMLNETGNTDRE